MSTVRSALIPLLPSLLLAACAVHAEPATPATPQRPTVSVDTKTTAPDTVELEAGVSVDPSDTFDSPLRLKYGLGPHTEFAVGISPLVYLSRPGSDGSGNGDVTIGTKHRVVDQDGDWPALAFGLVTKLPAASSVEGIGSGEIDFFAEGVASADYDDVGLTAYYAFGALGAPRARGVDGQHTGALAASVALGGGFGAFGELAGVFERANRREAVFTTLGVTQQPLVNLVLDAGVVVGLSDDAPDFAVVAGMTINFGRLTRRGAARRSSH